MNICWVTGAQGQVGRALKHHVEFQENQNYLFLTRADFDITDLNAAEKFAKNNPPDCIINLAAYTDVNGAEDNLEKAYSVNSEGVRNLATIAAIYNAVMIQISTDYVFDGAKPSPYIETDETNPINVYGKSKLKGEKYAQNLCPKHLVIRTSWIFSEFGKNFAKTMIHSMASRTPVRVIDDQLGGPTSARSLAAILYQLSSRAVDDQAFNHWGIFHFCQKPYVSWFDFCCKIQHVLASQKKKISSPKPCGTAYFPQAAQRPTNSTLNCGKIEKLGFPTTSWISDLERVVKFYENS